MVVTRKDSSLERAAKSRASVEPRNQASRLQCAEPCVISVRSGRTITRHFRWWQRVSRVTAFFFTQRSWAHMACFSVPSNRVHRIPDSFSVLRKSDLCCPKLRSSLSLFSLLYFFLPTNTFSLSKPQPWQQHQHNHQQTNDPTRVVSPILPPRQPKPLSRPTMPHPILHNVPTWCLHSICPHRQSFGTAHLLVGSRN